MSNHSNITVLEVNGLQLHVIETKKYKTNTIVLHMKNSLNKDIVTKRALIPYILQSGSKSYPSRQAIRTKLEQLYGATLSVDVGKKGENQVLSFRMEVANEKYLSDRTPLLEETLKLLADVVVHPHLEEGEFAKNIVENEKRNLKQRIQSIYDDKIRYANMRITEEMCKDETYGISVWGYEDEIDPILPEQLYDEYKKMLTNDDIDLYIVGDVNVNEIRTFISNYFQLERVSKRIKNHVPTQQKKIEKENIVFERQPIKQGKLHIGFRTNTTYSDDDYFAMQLFNGIFGGFSHSKLFINVREKASLAYYASSRYESHKGILMVMSGIEFANYDQAVKIIKEQLSAMQDGDITEEEISQTKAVLKNQVLETIDVAKGFVDLDYHNVISGVERSIDEWISSIDGVTKEEIVKVAEKVQLDTIYFLTGKEEK